MGVGGSVMAWSAAFCSKSFVELDVENLASRGCRVDRRSVEAACTPALSGHTMSFWLLIDAPMTPTFCGDACSRMVQGGKGDPRLSAQATTENARKVVYTSGN